MRKLLVCALLASCVPPGPATTPLIPMPARTETVTTEREIDGVKVKARPASATGWRFTIENETDSPVFIVWDESAFVAESGESLGRLIPGNTRRMDVEKAHPPTTVPAHAHATELALVHGIIGAEEAESDYAEFQAKHGGVSPEMNESIQGNRAIRRGAISGGRIDLVIQVGDEKQTWTGRVSK